MRARLLPSVGPPGLSHALKTASVRKGDRTLDLVPRGLATPTEESCPFSYRRSVFSLVENRVGRIRRRWRFHLLPTDILDQELVKLLVVDGDSIPRPILTHPR